MRSTREWKFMRITLALVCVLALAVCKKKEGTTEQPAPSGGTTAPVEPAPTPTPAPPAADAAPTPTPPPPPAADAAPAPTPTTKLVELTGTLPPTVTAERPPAVAWDNPASDYQSLKALKAAGEAAVGKVVAISVYTIQLAPPAGEEIMVELYECKPAEGDEMAIYAHYDPSLRDFLRAMPTGNACDTACPRVLIKVTGFDSSQNPIGDLQAVYDLQPDPSPGGLPEGVDFITMDDALLAGPDAVGKVAEFGVYMGAKTEEDAGIRWDLHPQACGNHGGYNATLHLYENDDNRAFIQGLPFDAGATCRRIRVKITKAPYFAFPRSFTVELLGVGATYPRMSPEPCP